MVTGPSGVGKTYLAEQLILKHPLLVEQIKLFTTRTSRPNEHLADRIFISEKEFREKKLRGDFLIAEKFHENWYGYTKSALKPTYKHLIVNAWPDLLPKFEKIPNICLIGLTSEKTDIELLKKRMLERGDSTSNVTERLKLVRKDISDLKIHEKIVREYGKLFNVTNDRIIHQKVIPWIEKVMQA